MEPIQFDWLGLHLQEPMAGITNGLLSVFSFYAYFRLRQFDNDANKWWRLFYLFFGISTLLGAMGHLFFHYFGITGKFPCWAMGTLANVCAARGMLSFFPYAKPGKYINEAIWMKGAILLILAIVSQKFIFIALDAILTYITFTGIYGWQLSKRGAEEAKWMVIGVIILLPSAFIFLLKLNPHRWLNKDDLSHILMLVCIYCFFIAMNKWGSRTTQHEQHV